MKYSGICCTVALALIFVGPACSSSKPSGAKKIVTVESREPLNINDGSGSISIRVKDTSTIIIIDKRRFVCRDYAGYIAQVNGNKGWIKIGRLDFNYDSEKIFIRGINRWQTFRREGDQSYFAAQDGTVGRSVFKD